jgi:plasmid stabilization system protein ParE
VSRSVKLASGVRDEIREAAGWYRERDRDVAIRFVAGVDRAIRRATQWPDAGSPVEGTRSTNTIRRVPVGRFPYQVVYARVEDVVLVLAVAHHHRRPGYWSGRLPS